MAAAWVIARAETSRGSGAGPGHENIISIKRMLLSTLLLAVDE